MVVYVVKWDIAAGTQDAYAKWAERAIKRTVIAPYVTEYCAYRIMAGDAQAVATHTFPDMATWAQWQALPDIQAVFAELHSLGTNVSAELWGPSPFVPNPIRPGG